MELQVQSFATGSDAVVSVSDLVFGREFNEPLVHQVITAYLSAARSGTKAQKTRAEVSGGGQKPWRQKGTGRARAGTTRGPIWRGGGRAFAARPRDFKQKLNRKMYRGALRSIVSELVRQGRLIVVEEFVLPEPKTKAAVAALGKLGLERALIVTEEMSENLFLAARNMVGVGLVEVEAVDPVLLVGYDTVIITRNALVALDGMLS